ncbi:hypothetical protein HYE68_005435 [Fusarium pseudograminearum]|nr:hypothetical protein HYE68_005435 [Fusarium pseudograminearum]
MAESSMDELIYSLSLLSISEETQEEQHEFRHEENTHDDNNEASSIEATKIEQAIKIEPAPKSSMYPTLHEYIVRALGKKLKYSFRDHNTKVDIKRQSDTTVIGKFECRRPNGHRHKWNSNCIAITIREYRDRSYNVLVYHQRCSKCLRPTRAEVDKHLYAERVAFYLKRWNGVKAKRVERHVSPNGDHMEKLCQGCKEGHCTNRKSRLRI